jgi:hypothetical protein
VPTMHFVRPLTAMMARKVISKQWWRELLYRRHSHKCHSSQRKVSTRADEKRRHALTRKPHHRSYLPESRLRPSVAKAITVGVPGCAVPKALPRNRKRPKQQAHRSRSAPRNHRVIATAFRAIQTRFA